MLPSPTTDSYDDHPSICDSLEDFEPSDYHRFRSSTHGRNQSLDIPSQHSGFRSESSEPESASESAWSPPAWRQHHLPRTQNQQQQQQQQQRPGSGWFQHDRLAPVLPTPERSFRDTSPGSGDVDGDEDLTVPANVPLPRSPEKRQSPSASPGPDGDEQTKQEGALLETEHERDHSAEPEGAGPPNNYLLWSMHFKLRHRTEPFEAAFQHAWKLFARATASPSSILITLAVTLLTLLSLRLLTRPLPTGPAPDLVKVAGLAKSFETLIHYSENGVQQIGDLQETGVAVWDLGESVRTTNMTSAPIITKSLDELSESLKTLALELTRFFANVDGDVDSILLVMDWAKRELSQVSSQPLTSLTSAFDNMHHLLSHFGLLESSTGEPTTVGKLVRDIFGPTHLQRTRAALHRTFTEFLTVLEDSINSELTYSTALFGLFEAIDRQFLNLQRTVIRETDQQEREEGAMLASLWTRVLGSNASALRKYEKNLQLLASVRSKTVRNKHILVDHNGKLLKLKSNLEILRKKLVSPLVRSNDSSTLSVEEQIAGLSGTYEHLKDVRERQKSKLLERLYGAGNRLRPGIEGRAGTEGVLQ